MLLHIITDNNDTFHNFGNFSTYILQNYKLKMLCSRTPENVDII